MTAPEKMDAAASTAADASCSGTPWDASCPSAKGIRTPEERLLPDPGAQGQRHHPR